MTKIGFIIEMEVEDTIDMKEQELREQYGKIKRWMLKTLNESLDDDGEISAGIFLNIGHIHITEAETENQKEEEKELQKKISEPGLLFDGTFGQNYNDMRLCLLAQTYGFEKDMKFTEENSTEYADEALKYLNEHGVEKNIVIDWVEGDLMALSENDESAESF